jgi:hypothetical protein
MNNKASILLAVTILGALLIPIYSHTARANYPLVHIDGEDYSYYEWFSNPSLKPWFCECYHSAYENAIDDAMVGLGVVASYTWGETAAFDWAMWDFNCQAGGDAGAIVHQYGSMYVDVCVNGDDHMYYEDTTEPQWGVPPGPFAYYECEYVNFNVEGEIYPYVQSVEGEVHAQFIHPSYPWAMWWQFAYTQNPDYYPNGHGWSFVYAWAQ